MFHRVLCVDSDTESLQATVDHLQSELADSSVSFETAETVEEANTLLTKDLSAIITEYSLSDGTGTDLIASAREACPDAGCILYTDADPERIDTTDLRGAVTEYVGKDSLFGQERLAELLRTTIETSTQRSYPLPQNEAERVASLEAYDLNDDELLESLNRITDLAADHFDVPRASVNIINEHSQDFLACYGGAENWDAMDREDSICTFTILEDDDVMAVEDVSKDPRFESRSEALIEKGIRAYMGGNLVTESGLVIGSLCIYDESPRSFSTADKAYLRTLAALAVDFIETYTARDPNQHTEGTQ